MTSAHGTSPVSCNEILILAAETFMATLATIRIICNGTGNDVGVLCLRSSLMMSWALLRSLPRTCGKRCFTYWSHMPAYWMYMKKVVDLSLATLNSLFTLKKFMEPGSSDRWAAKIDGVTGFCEKLSLTKTELNLFEIQRNKFCWKVLFQFAKRFIAQLGDATFLPANVTPRMWRSAVVLNCGSETTKRLRYTEAVTDVNFGKMEQMFHHERGSGSVCHIVTGRHVGCWCWVWGALRGAAWGLNLRTREVFSHAELKHRSA